MKQLIVLTPEQKSRVVNAMTCYREGLVGSGRALFDIAFNKIRKMNMTVELDGMEMIYVTNALRKKQMERTEYQEYKELADFIEALRKTFQRLNGPKIKKEAQTTVHASTQLT